MSDPFNKPSAWRGLEPRYREFLGSVGPIRTVVEIGVDYGFSLFHLARDHPHAAVVGIDPYTNGLALHADAEEWVKWHLKEFPNAILLTETSRDSARSLNLTVDLLHIDALHEYENVKEDFEAWAPKVRPGGCVMFHDVESFIGVKRFFHELVGRKELIREHHGLGFWFKDAP